MKTAMPECLEETECTLKEMLRNNVIHCVISILALLFARQFYKGGV